MRDIELRIDGAEPITADLVARVLDACARIETEPGRIILRVSGTPDADWAGGLTVGLVSRWERALRRLERLPAISIAVADGTCGGIALDALLATDLRIATTSTLLVLPVDAGATWPGMALYRLAQLGAHVPALRRAALLGEPIVALDALALHLVDEVVDDARAALATAVARTAAVRGEEVAIRRQLLFDASTTSFEEALGAHLAACDRSLRRSVTT